MPNWIRIQSAKSYRDRAEDRCKIVSEVISEHQIWKISLGCMPLKYSRILTHAVTYQPVQFNFASWVMSVVLGLNLTTWYVRIELSNMVCNMLFWNLVQIILEHPVSLVLNHPVILGWKQQVSGWSNECCTGIQCRTSLVHDRQYSAVQPCS